MVEHKRIEMWGAICSSSTTNVAADPTVCSQEWGIHAMESTSMFIASQFRTRWSSRSLRSFLPGPETRKPGVIGREGERPRGCERGPSARMPAEPAKGPEELQAVQGSSCFLFCITFWAAFLCSTHFPSGVVMFKVAIQEIILGCQAHQIQPDQECQKAFVQLPP